MASKAVSKLFAFFFSRVFPLIFISIGVLILYAGIKQIHNARLSKSWPSSLGQVISSEVVEHYGDESVSYSAEIEFEYTVSGKYYRGDRISYGGTSHSEPKPAEEDARRYPAGSDVLVYYKPDSPDESLLEPGLSGKTWVLAIIGLVFSTVGILTAIFLPAQFRKK